MSKVNYVWAVRDEYHDTLSFCKSKQQAQKQLEILAEFTAWNRSTKISRITDTVIYFENFDFVDIKQVPQINTKNAFALHFGFYGNYPKNEQNENV